MSQFLGSDLFPLEGNLGAPGMWSLLLCKVKVWRTSATKRYLYWYSLWRGTEGSGVRLVTWPQDRLGMLKPFSPSSPQAISCPIQVLEGQGKVYVNASGLSEHSQLRIGLLDEGFRPITDTVGEFMRP